MINRFRLALIASLLGLVLTGTTINTFAEAEENLSAVCNQQADDNALAGEDRQQFIQDCLQNVKEESGTQEK